MVNLLELMGLREKQIGELIKRIRDRSGGFRKPPIIVIGGYALRAFVPFARYSRDCDFALPKARGWNLEKVQKWLPEQTIESMEKSGTYGYLRVVQVMRAGRINVKIALDFMEGEIRGRSGEAFLIDDRFVADSANATIKIGDEPIELRVPSYQDYLLMKLQSARPGDVRDIVALLWKQCLPETDSLARRASEVLRQPLNLTEKLKIVRKDVADPRFLDSWRGTFMAQDFSESDKQRVLKELQVLQQVLR